MMLRLGRFQRAWRVVAMLALVLPAIGAAPPARVTPVPPRIVSAPPPPPAREFRGLWVATVNNVDWPSQPGLSERRQKAELIAILDRAAALNFNTVILQVRPCCDALYHSKIEPWSEYLTGRMGGAPWLFYDPLAFAVTEAHKRGLELHAWFNPFRVRMPGNTNAVARQHISRTRPDWVRYYNGYQWLDPGNKAARDYSLGVIMDVVCRYDIDGVHFDDFFYPYPNPKHPEEFPDEPTWRRYRASGGRLARADWRRDNVNQFIEQTYRSIKAAKPWVQFGVSPFGIWQPKHPPQIQKGLNAYDQIYADARKWLAEGRVDYLAPQLYWGINSPWSFPVLLQWWAEQNPLNRHLYAGMCLPQEAADQIALTRRQPGVSGGIFYHAQMILQNTNHISDTFRQVYATPALTPANLWLSGTPPPKPILGSTRYSDKMRLNWKSATPVQPARWVLQLRYGQKWTTQIVSGDKNAIQISPAPDVVALSAVDRYGNISAPEIFARK